jgi:hypothetical protein
LQNLELIPTDSLACPTRNDNDQNAANLQRVNNLQNAELICDYTHDQDWWCEALVNKEMFPWLWDIDTHVIRERQQTGHWNRELLARQLSQTKIHEPRDITLELPLQLRNRRRIWRLLEEGRVDDVAGPEGSAIQARLEERDRLWAEKQAKNPLPPIPFPGTTPCFVVFPPSLFKFPKGG